MNHDRDEDFGNKARKGHRVRWEQSRREAIAESIELEGDNR